MRMVLPKFRQVGAYASLALLFAGWIAIVLVFILARMPAEASDTVTSGSLEGQRMAAIEEARKQGKHEYSFDASKVPVPVSP